mgnify:CR=1 FL=1
MGFLALVCVLSDLETVSPAPFSFRNLTESVKNPPTPMFEQAFKNIDDVLWKEAGCTTELDYTEQNPLPTLPNLRMT